MSDGVILKFIGKRSVMTLKDFLRLWRGWKLIAVDREVKDARR